MTSTPVIRTTTVQKRFFTDSTVALFKESFRPAENHFSSVDALLSNFSSHILNILDDTAPVKTKTVSRKQTAP